MPASSVPGPSIAAFTSQYDQYLLRVRGSAVSTRRLHRYVTQRWLASRFPNGVITWSDLRFSDCATFVRTEFARLSSRDTQQTWLMILRSLLRYLADVVGERQIAISVRLRAADVQHAIPPVNITHRQIGHLLAAKPETEKHQQEGTVSQVSWRVLRACAEESLNLGLGQLPRETRMLAIGDPGQRRIPARRDGANVIC